MVRTDLKVAKNGSDFTLNNDPSCPGKVVLIECYKLSKNVIRVVLKKWSDLS